MLADAEMDSEEVNKFQDKQYQAQLAQKKAAAAAAAEKKREDNERKMLMAQQDQVDFHFNNSADEMFEENVQLRGEDDKGGEDSGDDSGDDQDERGAYPNISSSGGFVIKLGS